VTFAYYARLSRAQQAVYRRSDAVIELPLPRPRDLWPLVGELESALRTEDRARTERQTAALVRALTETLRVPPVRIEVLAARPHARWGELHGLYTAEPGRVPRIQLWMRTAKQKRVVAFRTFLRTLLHEVGHHLDYQLLKLGDSYHTEGFYKRESSLFHQLVTDRRPAMPTPDDWATRPIEERLQRLARTADEITLAVRGATESALSRRPEAASWAAKEVVCHLRDAEELFGLRLRLTLTVDEPVLPAAEPDRWAEERQYVRNELGLALTHFRRRRVETLEILGKLGPEQWRRAGRHPVRGRLTCDAQLAHMAWHDDNHLDQLTRALAGQP
jgi:DinB family protein